MRDSTPDGRGRPDRFDVLRYPNGTHRPVPAGDGERIVAAHELYSRKRRLIASLVAGFLPLVVGFAAWIWVLDTLVLPLVVGSLVGVVAGVVRYRVWNHDVVVPELAAADASPRLVRDYVDDFDPEDVEDPFR